MKPQVYGVWTLVLLFILPNWNWQTEAKNNYDLLTENFTCSTQDVHSTIIKELNCGLNKNAKRRTWHLEFALKQQVKEHDFLMRIVLPRQRPLTDFVLIDLTTDGCQLLANRNQVPLMRLGRNIMDRFSNFPKQCPFKANYSYYIRGFRMDLNLLPAVDMETPVNIEFSYQSKHQALKWITGYMGARVQRIPEKNSKG